MLDREAPLVLQQWIINPPSWLSVQAVSVIDTSLCRLDPGEQAAITLAQTLPADLLIIDERLGRQIAMERGIAIIGTLGILDAASDQGLINLAEVIAELQKTNFRASHRIIQVLLNKLKN